MSYRRNRPGRRCETIGKKIWGDFLVKGKGTAAGSDKVPAPGKIVERGL